MKTAFVAFTFALMALTSIIGPGEKPVVVPTPNSFACAHQETPCDVGYMRIGVEGCPANWYWSVTIQEPKNAYNTGAPIVGKTCGVVYQYLQKLGYLVPGSYVTDYLLYDEDWNYQIVSIDSGKRTLVVTQLY